MTVISVIIGSTRDNRFSEKPARWIANRLDQRKDIQTRVLDLRDFPLPFFESAVPPAMPGRQPYDNERVRQWTAAIAASDGFVVATPEYNFGTSAVLKNAIDWVYPEWNRKAVACVAWGSQGGVRAVQQLRETAVELQMAPTRTSIQIPMSTLMAHFQGNEADIQSGLKALDAQADAMIDDLLWWTRALKAARAGA